RADQPGRDALGHGPAQERHGGVEACGVALGDEHVRADGLCGVVGADAKEFRRPGPHRDEQQAGEQRDARRGGAQDLQLVPTLPSGSVPSSSAAPFQNTWMPMQNSRNADSRTMMVVPVGPMKSASRAEWR